MDVDFEQNVIRVRGQVDIQIGVNLRTLLPAKTKAGNRDIPMAPGLAIKLKEFLDYCDGDSPREPAWVTISEASKAVGIEYVSPVCLSLDVGGA